VTKYAVMQELKIDGRASTWDDLGEFEGRNAEDAAQAAVVGMSTADQAKAKLTKFRVVAVSALNDLPAPSGITVETKVSFA
jgi:hypothetical protein